MAKILMTRSPVLKETLNVRIDDRTVRPGNAISIILNGMRVALGRVKQDVSQDPRFTCEKYVDPRREIKVDAKTNMAKNVWRVEVECIFGENDEH